MHSLPSTLCSLWWETCGASEPSARWLVSEASQVASPFAFGPLVPRCEPGVTVVRVVCLGLTSNPGRVEKKLILWVPRWGLVPPALCPESQEDAPGPIWLCRGKQQRSRGLCSSLSSQRG